MNDFTQASLAQRTRPNRVSVAWAGSRLWIALIVGWPQPGWAIAQENESKEQSALVDGLLDLIREPTPKPSEETASSPTQPEVKSIAGEGMEQMDAEGRSHEASLEGNPLAVVRNNMRIAANQLSKGVVGAETRMLQSDIVRRLDALIDEMQRSNPPESPQPKRPQQRSSTAQSSTASQSSDTSPDRPTHGSESNQPSASGDRQPHGNDDSHDSSSQAGSAAEVTVDLADPQQLQQDVWGQLPDQVRKQMQSKMVERFLPSHRTQIEAYFRALLQTQTQ